MSLLPSRVVTRPIRGDLKGRLLRRLRKRRVFTRPRPTAASRHQFPDRRQSPRLFNSLALRWRLDDNVSERDLARIERELFVGFYAIRKCLVPPALIDYQTDAGLYRLQTNGDELDFAEGQCGSGFDGCLRISPTANQTDPLSARTPQALDSTRAFLFGSRKSVPEQCPTASSRYGPHRKLPAVTPRRQRVQNRRQPSSPTGCDAVPPRFVLHSEH